MNQRKKIPAKGTRARATSTCPRPSASHAPLLSEVLPTPVRLRVREMPNRTAKSIPAMHPAVSVLA